MKPHASRVRAASAFRIGRRSLIAALAALAPLLLGFSAATPQLSEPARAQGASAADPLASWTEGSAKQAIVAFVRAASDPASPHFIAQESRIATFDLDGTLWVEQPMYTQVVYALDRVPAVVKEKPELAGREPFKTVLSGSEAAIATLPFKDIQTIFEATLTGMSVEAFRADAKEWLQTARHPRWNRPYVELAYQPMKELIDYLRAAGFRTYIVTGSGQDFVRVFAENVFGIPPEQVVGTADATNYAYGADGKPLLFIEPKVLLDDNFAGKPEGIHFMIGRRPYAAFGNSTGDRQMLEYVKAGPGARLAMIVLHDDAEREYAYGPARGLPQTRVGYFPQSLYEEARKQGWIVISVKNDWKRVFAFE